jgi:hypothetical protein
MSAPSVSNIVVRNGESRVMVNDAVAWVTVALLEIVRLFGARPVGRIRADDRSCSWITQVFSYQATNIRCVKRLCSGILR